MNAEITVNKAERTEPTNKRERPQIEIIKKKGQEKEERGKDGVKTNKVGIRIRQQIKGAK